MKKKTLRKLAVALPLSVAAVIGVACAVAYVVACCLYGKKRAAKKLSMNS